VYISIYINSHVFCVKETQSVMIDRRAINKGNKLLFIQKPT